MDCTDLPATVLSVDDGPETGGDDLQAGLRLTFDVAPPGVVATFEPRPEHRGAPGLLHGGVAATCLDETMAVLGYALDGVHYVTATLELRYRRPVPLDGQALRAEAWRDPAEGRRRHRVYGRLLLADGTVAVEAKGIFVQAAGQRKQEGTLGDE
jgi:acyl-coenzyme A thioesterase PaaI-like protein